jgi:hypothetical protein
LKHSSLVLVFTAVVWRGEERHDLPIIREWEIIPAEDRLMCATHEIERKPLSETLQRRDTENVTRAAVIRLPLVDGGIRIRPEHIAEQPVLGNFKRPLEPADLVEV